MQVSSVVSNSSACPLLPLPVEFVRTAGQLPVTTTFSVAVMGHDDARLQGALVRALRRWEERTGMVFARPRTGVGGKATLVVDCTGPGHAWPTVGEDESYALDVTPERATLRAATVPGAMHGLETLLQLLRADAEGWHLPAVTINDQPRFPWRGLMLDVCRHWVPLETIKRQLDGMAVVKLNVLHLHLTDDQGFRIESRTHPRLHECGSDGLFYTQDQMRELIAYAAARGIRVVPEIDVPGHATSWLVGYPELASQPGPYAIERRWGICDPTLDPTNEKVYTLIDAFFGEMAALFPDAYLHIGGDEVNGKQWNANPRLQEFIAAHGLKNNAGLQAYFNRRVQQLVAKHGKKMLGWDEILHPDLPREICVQSWRGVDSMATAVRLGCTALLSCGYYLDHLQPASWYYANDPLPEKSTLTPEEARRVLGGEACMWSEWATDETLDSRIWPRAAAIAERFWSPRSVTDPDDMYRRLAKASRRLEEVGLRHVKNPAAMLRRFAGEALLPPAFARLSAFLELVEAGGIYEREQHTRTNTQSTPLTGLIDCAPAESDIARKFAAAVRAWLFSERDPAAPATLELCAQLEAWRELAQDVADGLGANFGRLREAAPAAQAMAYACTVGLEAVQALASRQPLADDWVNARLAHLSTPAQAHAGLRLPVAVPVGMLVAAAKSARR
ncbi:MAG: family 20 glycosylhydrolase [Opitutae bacterium]|nr:family 20 glycosylhydrolase [Opitutae bacterium]